MFHHIYGTSQQWQIRKKNTAVLETRNWDVSVSWDPLKPLGTSPQYSLERGPQLGPHYSERR